VGTKLLSPLIAATQDILYSLPRLNADQRLVLACVLRATVVDLADVVGVAQEPVKLADRDWLGGTLEAWDGGQAACDSSSRNVWSVHMLVANCSNAHVMIGPRSGSISTLFCSLPLTIWRTLR